MLSLGLIVNPLAGIGGPAGLAGSDGIATQTEAFARGVRPRAGERAARFLRQLNQLCPEWSLSLAARGEMGAAIARRIGIDPRVVVTGSETRDAPMSDQERQSAESLVGLSSAEDTKSAARAMLDAEQRPDAIVFVGGDGTARDVHDAVGTKIAVLGVPAGVKMQSAVFARSPETAASLLASWSESDRATELREVADIDEEARRQGRVVAQVWGEMRVPLGAGQVQGGKVGQSRAALGSLPGIAAGLAERLKPESAWLMGPGGTVRSVAEELGLPASLLGVDLHLPNGSGPRISHLDLSAREIDERLSRNGLRTQIIVSPIGGQGFVLGRGNQQIDAAVLARLEDDGLLIIATPLKLSELGGRPLYAELPEDLQTSGLLGPRRVITGRSDTAMVQLLAA